MKYISLKTTRRDEMIDISGEVQRLLASVDVRDGLAVIHCPHTTAGLTISEGADPAVKADIIDCLNDLAPWNRIYGHAEGNSPAHVKAILMGSTRQVIIKDGQLLLGQWQRIFFCEFDGPRPRTVFVKFMAG